ncbi:MAG: hypothetical protein HZA95_02215 [Candidatus Vogelbacteria bacterium]|nr:hypothetical protein [Candidatus Vogelbacteria bacterium]
MGVKIEVDRNQNENNASVIRRFTKRVQDSGILKRARSLRYAKRKPSSYAIKKSALTKIGRRTAYERLKKLGKIEDGFAKKTRRG